MFFSYDYDRYVASAYQPTLTKIITRLPQHLKNSSVFLGPHQLQYTSLLRVCLYCLFQSRSNEHILIAYFRYTYGICNQVLFRQESNSEVFLPVFSFFLDWLLTCCSFYMSFYSLSRNASEETRCVTITSNGFEGDCSIVCTCMQITLPQFYHAIWEKRSLPMIFNLLLRQVLKIKTEKKFQIQFCKKKKKKRKKVTYSCGLKRTTLYSIKTEPQESIYFSSHT